MSELSDVERGVCLAREENLDLDGRVRGRIRVRSLVWLVILLSSLAIGFGFLWPQRFGATGIGWVSVSWFAFMVRVMLIPFGVVLVGLLVGAVVLRWWKHAAATGVLVAITLGPEVPAMVRSSTMPASLGATSLRVMSVNVLSSNSDVDAVVKCIAETASDVVFVVECSHAWDEALSAALGETHPYQFAEPRAGNFGMAVYSRVEIVAEDVSLLSLHEPPNSQYRVVVEFGGERVALYGVHLMPPMGRNLSRRSRSEFVKLVGMLEDEALPFVVAGDFNFTPRSPQGAVLRGMGLREVHGIAGSGLGTTWRGSGLIGGVLPGLRLDQMYVSSELGVVGSSVLGEVGSDHRPIVGDFVWK